MVRYMTACQPNAEWHYVIDSTERDCWGSKIVRNNHCAHLFAEHHVGIRSVLSAKCHTGITVNSASNRSLQLDCAALP